MRAGGQHGWVVSAGVLAALLAIFAAGAVVIDSGGGARGSAAALPTVADTRDWTATTLAPESNDAVGSPTASTGPGAGSSPTPDDDTAGVVDDGETVAAGAATPGTSPATAGISATDRQAGVATQTLVQAGTGRLLVVPGSAAAPNGAAPRMRVRVEIEEGIGAEGQAFAAFVMATLNDPRSWGHGGAKSFARTDGDADFRVILASPDTSARLCAPAQTRGTLSCGGGGKAVITMYRWMSGIPDYRGDITGYRRYVVNHEVGHVLGHGHAYCDPGHLAPVMVQQTKGLHGCLPNPWPFPVS